MDKLRSIFESKNYKSPPIPNGHEQRFKQKLEKTFPHNYKRKLALTITVYGAAASIGLILFLGVLKTQNTIENHTTPITQNSEIVEAEIYYKGLVESRLLEIEQLNTQKDDIYEILEDISEFDDSLQKLKNDLKQAPDDERIIAAMLNSYMMKIEVLDDIVEILQKKG